MEITLRDKMLLEIGIIPKSMKHDAAEAEIGADSRGPSFNYYRCPLCGAEYHRPFGERKSRPIRRCLKCQKVVTMEQALHSRKLASDDDDVDWVTVNGTHMSTPT